jgi:hypothetical protein
MSMARPLYDFVPTWVANAPARFLSALAYFQVSYVRDQGYAKASTNIREVCVGRRMGNARLLQMYTCVF